MAFFKRGGRYGGGGFSGDTRLSLSSAGHMLLSSALHLIHLLTYMKHACSLWCDIWGDQSRCRVEQSEVAADVSICASILLPIFLYLTVNVKTMHHTECHIDRI